MEIMGGLIVLGAEDRLPIPWFMRSHLGLETRTGVWYALTEPHRGSRLPDIVVSPIDPRRFHETTSVTIANREGVGTLAEVLDHIKPPVNIALADSVTIEGRARHRINLVLERSRAGDEDAYTEARANFIRQFSPAPGQDDYELSFENLYPKHRQFKACNRVPVTQGWIDIGGLIERIRKDYGDQTAAYDLSRLVVSSNPEKRLLRYIIPRKGVVTFRIPHEDAPGVLHKVVHGLASAKYNILCSRLSRTPPIGSTEYTSIFVAECEPSDDSPPPEEVIWNISQIDEAGEGTFNRGRRASETLYPRPAGAVISRPPEKYATHIQSLKKSQRDKGPSVFLSRRFLETKENIDHNTMNEYTNILREVRKGIEEAGWVVHEAPPDKPDKEIDLDVFPGLWVAEAMLVVAYFDDRSGRLSPNQAHELGFAMGQSKPVAILSDTTKLGDFNVSNYAGRQVLDFRMSLAFNSDNPASIRSKIRAWLGSIDA